MIPRPTKLRLALKKFTIWWGGYKKTFRQSVPAYQ